MRLIDADKLEIRKFTDSEIRGYDNEAAYRVGWNDAIDGICENEPTIEPQRKGHIIIRSNMLDGEDCFCSECDHWALLPDYKFCPYCGVAFEDVISERDSERETMEEFMYGWGMGNPEDGSL